VFDDWTAMSAKQRTSAKQLEPVSISTGILVFDDIEELDFVGPWEVFGVANRLYPGSFPTQLLGVELRKYRGRYGMTFDAVGSLYDPPSPRLLVIPGGPGRRIMMQDSRLLAHLKEASADGALLASVCTGALVLAAAGLLDGKSATTHLSALDELRGFPKVTVVKQRFVDAGEIVTAAGISAGIDMSLHLVARFLGKKAAERVASTMEYSSTLA
jgi:transcriptional regulator GlxA family with amidase domain